MSPRLLPKTLILAALIAAPSLALAQPAPPPPPPMGGPGGPGGPGMMGQRMFPSMSEAGRAIIREAMMGTGDRREERQKIEAVRDRMMTALAADKFDAAAVKRAMDDERALSDASRQQRQAAMLAAFGKLSPEDRKAFVADSRAMKDRMQQRVAGLRDRWRERRGRMGDGPRPMPQE